MKISFTTTNKKGAPTSVNGRLFICLPVLGNVIGKGIIRVGCAQEGLDAEQHRPNLQGRAPLVLQNVQANSAKSIYVWMVYLREEANLRSAENNKKKKVNYYYDNLQSYQRGEGGRKKK